MSRNYSRKNFLRKVPNPLLRSYFTSRKIALEIDWGDLADTDAKTLFDGLEGLDEKTQARVDSEFAMINELSCDPGTRAILEEAVFWGRDWSADFERMENAYERAFWTFLNEPNRFRAAGAFHVMDRFGGWWRRSVGMRLVPATEQDDLEKLGTEIRKFYRKQGCGRYCHVDVYQRHDPLRFCFFAYPEDIATSDLGYEENGKFARRPRQSAFEVIFVYRPEEGMLELHARGVKKIKESLAEIFCTTTLGLTELPEEGARSPFDLSVLKSPDFNFPTEPRDGIADVELKLLRLDLPFDRSKGAGRRIVLSANPLPGAPNALHMLIDDAIHKTKLPFDAAIVSQAKLKFTFRSMDGERPKTLSFVITYPDGTSLRDDEHDQIAKACLRRWGIARD